MSAEVVQAAGGQKLFKSKGLWLVPLLGFSMGYLASPRMPRFSAPSFFADFPIPDFVFSSFRRFDIWIRATRSDLLTDAVALCSRRDTKRCSATTSEGTVRRLGEVA